MTVDDEIVDRLALLIIKNRKSAGLRESVILEKKSGADHPPARDGIPVNGIPLWKISVRNAQPSKKNRQETEEKKKTPLHVSHTTLVARPRRSKTAFCLRPLR